MVSWGRRVGDNRWAVRSRDGKGGFGDMCMSMNGCMLPVRTLHKRQIPLPSCYSLRRGEGGQLYPNIIRDIDVSS